MWSSDMERIVINTNASVAVLAALALCACASPGRHHEDLAQPLTPTEHYAIDVSPQPEELRLAIHRQGLSPNQAQALAAFADRWNDADGGEITLQSPARGADPASVYRIALEARDFLASRGVTPEKLRLIGYDARGDAQAPLIIGYSHYVAKGPECGRKWENLTATGANRAYGEFGCAVTANIAAQIADPGDLMAPRPTAPADAARRQAVRDHYRKGETTSSAKDDQANGAVSTAVH